MTAAGVKKLHSALSYCRISSDLCAIEEGKVSITPIQLNLTHVTVADRLRPLFE